MVQRFQKFLRGDIDLAPIGIERREDNTPYCCTPNGACIFGWAGVDGIHFCFIRGFPAGQSTIAGAKGNALRDC